MYVIHIKKHAPLKSGSQLIFFIFIGVYRTHSGNIDGFIDELSTIFTKLPEFLRRKVMLFGDFNVNLLNEISLPAQQTYNIYDVILVCACKIAYNKPT